MSILLRCATAAVFTAAAPVAGGPGVETWTHVGRLRGLDVLVSLDQAYLDESGDRIVVSTRLEGDIDARLDALPDDLDGRGPTPRRVGVQAMQLSYVYNCETGEIADVRFHAAYDADARRMTAPPDFVGLVERSMRTGLNAASSPESRNGWRRLCARLRARAAKFGA